jgi:hypothetical protein
MRRRTLRTARRTRVSVTGYRRTSHSASAKVRDPGRRTAGADVDQPPTKKKVPVHGKVATPSHPTSRRGYRRTARLTRADGPPPPARPPFASAGACPAAGGAPQLRRSSAAGARGSTAAGRRYTNLRRLWTNKPGLHLPCSPGLPSWKASHSDSFNGRPRRPEPTPGAVQTRALRP